MHDDLASQAVQIEIGIEVFSELIYAIWNANDLETLCHLVGPSKEENEEANWRLEKLDKLSPKCAWYKQECQLTTEESEARAADRRIGALQDKFESKYC